MKEKEKKATSACGWVICSLAAAWPCCRSWRCSAAFAEGSRRRAGSEGCEGSPTLRALGGVSRSRLACFRLRCAPLSSVIAVFNLPHLRVHPGSSLLLVRKSPAAGSCLGQLRGSAPPPALCPSRNGAGRAAGCWSRLQQCLPAVLSSEKCCRWFWPTDVSTTPLLS